MAVLNWKQLYDLNSTTTFNANDVFYLARSPYGVGDDFGFLYSSLIPVTTKGDLYTFSTVNARLGVGANNTILTADSLQATGLAWTSAAYPPTCNRGDVIYAGAANAYSNLAGNTSVTKMYLQQVGNGVVPGAPSWQQINGSEIVGYALTAGNDTNVTLTLGGTPASALLNAASITAGWTGQLSLARGGTNANLTASNGGIVYSTATAFAVLSGTATPNQVLLSGAAGAPSWSIATYPSGTSINQILYSSANNVIDGLGTGSSSVLCTSSAGVPGFVGPLADGQLIIGSSAATPVAANLTAGTGISITNAAGSITISSPDSGVTWTNVTGTSQAMAVNNGYVANNAALVTLTLPTTAAVGDVFQIRGSGAGGFSIAQNVGQTIHVGSSASTTGVGGSVSSTNRYDCVDLTCVLANTDFVASGVQGALTVV